jgi:outer membrane protein assembly factor BamB
MRQFLLGWLMVVTAGAEAAEPAAQWRHWRGPHANGTAPHAQPPLTWSETKHVRWKTPIPGKGSSTPIIWGEQIFLLTAIATERVGPVVALADRLERKTTAPTNIYDFVLLSYDRTTGQERWRRTVTSAVPHEGHHPTHSYAAGSPTTDGQRLYVSFGSRGNYAYTLDGKLLWQRDLGRLATRLGWGEAVTPVIADDTVILNWDQEVGAAVYALDAATGAIRWKAERPDEKTSWNTPLVVTHQSRTQVIVNGTQKVRSYDLATGKVWWDVGGMTVNAIPSPVAADGVVYVMSGYRGAAAVAVPLATTSNSPTPRWRYDKGTPYVPSPALVAGRLWFTQQTVNLLTVLDTQTGTALIDRARLPHVKSFYASPLAAAGRIYLVDRDGTALVLKQADQLEVLAHNQLDDTFDASPVAVGRDLFLRGERHLYCLRE